MDDVPAAIAADCVSMLTGGPPPDAPPFTPDVNLAELVQLCAVDTELFSRTFFPKEFRQESPSYARELWDAMESANRYVNVAVFRGGSKTTRIRSFVAKLIAYGLLHT